MRETSPVKLIGSVTKSRGVIFVMQDGKEEEDA